MSGPEDDAEVVGRLDAARVSEGALVQLRHPPYHVLVTRVQGQLYALEDACPHSGQSLCEGWVRDHVLVCAGHGWEIDVRTGEVLTEVGRGERAPRYRVEEQGGELVVRRERSLGVEEELAEK